VTGQESQKILKLNGKLQIKIYALKKHNYRKGKHRSSTGIQFRSKRGEKKVYVTVSSPECTAIY
jgi:hypothetical protein